MLYCSLCFKTKDESGNKDFFKVPKDKRRRKKWGEICRIDFKRKAAWICQDHFLPSKIIKSENKTTLLPNTLPFIPPVKEPEKIIEAAYKGTSLKGRSCTLKNDKIPAPMSDASTGKFSQKSYCNRMTAAACQVGSLKNPVTDLKTETLPSQAPNENNENFYQIQENLVMEIPVKKTVFCTRPIQTNTRYCGLVETSEFADDFRLNCFYCSDIFPFEKWKEFTEHLMENHFEKEKAFETLEYTSDEHDYTPINLSSTSSLDSVCQTVGISPESLLPFLGNEEEPTIPINPTFLYTADEGTFDLIMDAEQPLVAKGKSCNNSEPVAPTTPPLRYAQYGEEEYAVHNLENSANTSLPFGVKKERNSTSFKHKSSKLNQMRNVSKQAQRKTVLSRFLKRTVREENQPEYKEDFCSSFTTIKEQSTPVISYEFSPSAIVDLLLESMRNHPALWRFNTEPFADDFSKSIADLCKIINEKWSLNIDHLTMRRSINRVLRFYCYLYPNENIENIHPFTCFYDKCAEFLPASVNEIAYARCSNCYICYKSDFDLKRHLLKEQSFNLKWPYKCVVCKECFKESDEYEFHKRLPHYSEVFRCEPCNKKYFRRNIYNRHISVYHPKESNERRFKCDECDKAYRTRSGLKGHKIYHGERKYKCHLCAKCYHEKAKLQIHLKTHRKEYDFICEVCAKEFVTQSALNVHMDKHTGEKVTCTMCNLKLRKSSLSRHLRLVHTPGDGNVPQNVRQRSKGKLKSYKRLVRAVPFLRRKESERRKYQCKVCMVRFERYKTLAEHNKDIHSDLPKWPCQLCPTVFSLKLNLKRHYRKKHNMHVIQVYKLVEEGDDLSDVLSIKAEQLDILAENGIYSTYSPPILDAEVPTVKSEFLSDECSMEENIQSFTIQEEIMEVAVDITKEEIKNNYMNDFFTDILK